MPRVCATKFLSLSFIALAAMLFAGCIHRPIVLTTSTKPLAQNGYTVIGRTGGEDCAYYLLGLIPLTNGNELHEAVADAMKKKPLGDAMIEVTVDYYFQWWILFTRACTQVHGTVVQSK